MSGPPPPLAAGPPHSHSTHPHPPPAPSPYGYGPPPTHAHHAHHPSASPSPYPSALDPSLAAQTSYPSFAPPTHAHAHAHHPHPHQHQHHLPFAHQSLPLASLDQHVLLPPASALSTMYLHPPSAPPPTPQQQQQRTPPPSVPAPPPVQLVMAHQPTRGDALPSPAPEQLALQSKPKKRRRSSKKQLAEAAEAEGGFGPSTSGRGKKRERQRALSPYNLFLKEVLASLKSTHGQVAHAHRFKVAASFWTEQCDKTAAIAGDKHVKTELQLKAWEAAQEDMHAILDLLRKRVEDSAEQEIALHGEDSKNRPHSEYNLHMHTELARLKAEQPETPYQDRFKLAASLWQQRKSSGDVRNASRVHLSTRTTPRTTPRKNPYCDHMKEELARLQREQPDVPYPQRFKHAAALWQDKKKLLAAAAAASPGESSSSAIPKLPPTPPQDSEEEQMQLMQAHAQAAMDVGVGGAVQGGD